MNTVAIVQARMGSSRLPGKVLMDIEGRTMLERVLERTSRAATLNGVVVATTTEASDDPVAALAARRGWHIFRGSQDDVLGRYVEAARRFDADVIVRVTSDCPLIDPDVLDAVVRARADRRADYCSNALARRTFPRGLDVESVTRAALERAHVEASAPHEREHVTPYVYGHPDRFVLTGVESSEDESRHRWTVDTPEDLALVRAVYREFGPDGPRTWRDVLPLLVARPDLAALNAHVVQKPLTR